MEGITSMVTIGDRKTPGYTISLDEIDLSLMPIFSHQRRDRTVPLWSPAASGPGAEYYEFQVLTKEGEDSDDETLENASTVRCHACATSVSVSHWQRHTTSSLHQANQTIAQISLRRAQQMALAPPVIPTPPSSSTYFCPSCCTAVALTKQATHKHSDEHSSNVLYAKLLQSFVKLYESKDNLNSVCEEVFKAIGDHETIHADLQSRNFFKGEILTKEKKNEDDANKNHNEEFDDDDGIEYERGIPLLTLKKKENTYDEKTNHKEGNYDNDDSCSTSESYDSNTEHTNTDFTITAQSGAKLRISFDNYHGFSTSCGKTLCRVCRVMVEDKEKHVLMKTHVDKFAVAVKDKHGIRPLTTILSHCVLCNDLVGNSDEGHMTSDAHIAALQRALIQDDIRGKPEDAYTKQVLTENFIQTAAFNDQNYYCPVCQIYIFKSALMEHVAMSAHKKGLNSFRTKKKDKAIVNKTGSSLSARFCEYCKVNVGNSKKAAKRHLRDKDHKLNVWLAEKDTMIHYHFKKSVYPDKNICNICSVLVDVDKVKEHINGFNHQKLYENMLKDNHMQETRGYNVNCFICNTKLYMIEVLDHIKHKSHKKRIKQCSDYDIGPEELKLIHQGNQDYGNAKLKKLLQLNRINNSYSKGEGYYECRACDISFLKPSLLQHIFTKKHRKNKHLTLINSVKQCENGKETKADYVKISCQSQTDREDLDDPVTTTTQDDPVTTTTQGKNATEIQANSIKTTTVQTMPKLALHRPIKKLHYLFEWTYDVELEVMCLVCETNLSFDDVMPHRKSKTHKELYKNLLETNTMFRIRNRCFCECCREIMKVIEEYTHFTSEKHRCNLARNTERLDQSALKELSIRMFNEDVAAGKRIKSHERYARTSITVEESEDEERNSEIDDTFWSVHNSTVTFDQVDEEKDSEEDNSVSDSDVSFESAETNDQDKDETNDVKDLSEKSEDHEIVDYIILETQSQEFLELPSNFQNIAHLVQQTDNTKELLCLICKSVVPNWSDQILKHVEGIKHIKKYKRVLQMHDLKEIFDVSTRTLEKYICKSCRIDVGKSDLFLHVNGEKHKLYLNAQPSTSGCSQQNNENTAAPANNMENKVETVSLSNITKKPVSKNQMSTEICSNITKDNSKLQVQQSHEIKSTIAETKDTNKTAIEIKQSEQTVVPTPDSSDKSDSSEPPIKQSDDIRLRSIKNKKTENSDTGIKEPKATAAQTKDEDIFQHNLKSSILVAPPETKDTGKSQHQIKQSVETQPSAKKSAESKSTLSQLYVKPSIPTHIVQAEAEKSKHIINKIQIAPCASAGTQNLEKRVEKVICNVNIPNNVTSIREHLMGNEHNENVKDPKKRQIINPPIKVNLQEKQITAQNTHITKVKPTFKVENKITNLNVSDSNVDPYIKEGICSLCNMKVSNNISNIKEHANGNNHKKMLQSLVCNKKSLTNTQTSNEVCQNAMSSAGSSQSKRKVVKKITIPYISAAQALLPENNVNTYVKNGHCYLCNLKIPDGVSNIKIHVNGKNHKGNLENVVVIETIPLNPPVVSKPIENNSKAKTKIVEKISNPVVEGPGAKLPENRIDIKMGHCYLCGMDIPNNISNIKDHVNGKTHRKMLQSLETTNTKNKDNVIVIPGSSENTFGNMETSTEREINIPIIVGAEAKLPENTIDTYVKKGYCYVCDKKVPNNVSNIEDHVEGKNHKQNLLSLQSNNSRVNISYVCPICNIKIPKNTKNVVNHLKNTMHKVNVAKLLNSTQNITTADPNSTNIGTGSSSVSVSKINDNKYEASRDKTNDNVQNTNSNSHKSKTIMQGNEKISVGDNTNNTNTAKYSSSYVGTNDSEVLKNEYAKINTKHDITATDLNSYVGTNDSEVSKNEYAKTENTKTNNTVFAETTSYSNKAYHSVDNVDSNTTTDSSCNVGNSDSGVINNKYAKTENTKTSKPVDDSEDNDANTSDIFYNCKTECDETDDSDVEALDEGFFICRVCDKLILDNETDIKSHLDSFRHKINLKEKQFKEGMFPNTETLCDICKVNVPNNPIAIKKHAESEMHRWRFEKVLLENKIKIRDDKVCHCEVCDLYFSKFTVSSHINRSNHIKHFS